MKIALWVVTQGRVSDLNPMCIYEKIYSEFQMQYWGTTLPVSLLHFSTAGNSTLQDSATQARMLGRGTAEGGAGKDREAWAGRRLRTGLMS